MEQLYTRWGRELNKEMPLSEYPRPQMVRDNWKNLNGFFDFHKIKTVVRKKTLILACHHSHRHIKGHGIHGDPMMAHTDGFTA